MISTQKARGGNVALRWTQCHQVSARVLPPTARGRSPSANSHSYSGLPMMSNSQRTRGSRCNGKRKYSRGAMPVLCASLWTPECTGYDSVRARAGSRHHLGALFVVVDLRPKLDVFDEEQSSRRCAVTHTTILPHRPSVRGEPRPSSRTILVTSQALHTPSCKLRPDCNQARASPDARRQRAMKMPPLAFSTINKLLRGVVLCEP